MNRIASRLTLGAIAAILIAFAQPASATTLAYDSFTRPRNTDLNAGRSGVDLIAPTYWVEDAGDGEVNGGVRPFILGVTPFVRVRNTQGLFTDGFVGADMQDQTAGGQGHISLIARAATDGSENFYEFEVLGNADSSHPIKKVINGNAIDLGFANFPFYKRTGDHRVVLEVSGTSFPITLRVYHNGVLAQTTYDSGNVDSTLLSGHAGFRIRTEEENDFNALVDNFKVATTFEEANDPGPPAVSLDTTPPVIVPTVTPAPNANGWNNTDVTVSWSVSDPESGIASSQSCSTTILVTETAGTLLTCSATNGVGLSSSASVTIKIDQTAPEALNQFDPATLDVVVLGRDALSGVPAGPIAPLSVVPTRWGRGDDDDNDDDDDDDERGNADLRTYLIQDAAGNILRLVEKVKREGHELKATIVSLQYNSGPVLTPTRNTKAFEWGSTKTGSLKELEQTLTLGRGPDKQKVQAKFEAKKNQTTIKVKHLVKTKQVLPGLVLLRFVTTNGSLTIEF